MIPGGLAVQEVQVTQELLDFLSVLVPLEDLVGQAVLGGRGYMH